MKKKLPANCEIEMLEEGTRDFRLHFYAEGECTEDYFSEDYAPEHPRQTVKQAALEVCERFGWIDNPPATGKKAPDLNTTVYRDFLIKCKANRGGAYLVPVSIQEIHLTPENLDSEYDLVGNPSPYFGEIREALEKRGDLVTLKSGDRITRPPHIGKTVRPGRNGKVFVQVRVRVREWKQFTKRTEDPKLQWLKDTCEAAGLRIVEHGSSWHAPITYVHRDDYADAWKILGPVDDVRDDAPRFRRHVAHMAGHLAQHCKPARELLTRLQS